MIRSRTNGSRQELHVHYSAIYPFAPDGNHVLRNPPILAHRARDPMLIRERSPGAVNGYGARRSSALALGSARSYDPSMDYGSIITIEPGKRGGKACIRGLRITVYDVLEYLASGMTEAQILNDFPDLTAEDIRACLAFAANRERRTTNITR